MGTSENNQELDAVMARALDAMWQKFLPDIRERVDTVTAAAQAAAAGDLDDEQRAAAQVAAHKLAGTLGTFGLTRGTVLARELEIRLGGDGVGREEAAELVSATTQLRALVDSRDARNRN